MIETTDLWKAYSQGRDYLNSINLFDRVETCFDMVNGDQWKGLKFAGERPPQLNILLPIMKSATSLVGQNVMNIEYISQNYGENRPHLLAVCHSLNSYARKQWERLKMDKHNWEILQDAYIAGNSAYWFYDDRTSEKGRILCEILDTTNIMLADEAQQDIQKQPYILIAQRKPLETVKNMARRYGLDEKEIKNILPEGENSLEISSASHFDTCEKVTVIAKLWKENGTVHIMRGTKTVIIQPDTALEGISRYPIAMYVWKPRKGTARGDGDVWDKVPNQISINKSLFRMEQAVKNSAYPIKVYRKELMGENQLAKLNQPGAAIALKGMGEMGVNSIVSYLQPAAISPYAQTYWQDLITLTKGLSGSGDTLENVDPEQASGVAIQAVMEAKQMNVNMQTAAFRQFVEDIAWIWYEMFVAYNPEGIDVVEETADGIVKSHISQRELKGLKVDIRVDALPASQTYAAIKDSQLKSLLDKGQITFEEYVAALADDSQMPVQAFRKIVENRKNALGGGEIYEM